MNFVFKNNSQKIQTSTDSERFCGRTVRFFNRGRVEANGPVQMIFHSDSGEQFLGFRIQYEITSGQSVGCESSPCQNGGDCIDLGPGEFICFCNDGFEGDLCEIGADPCDAGPCRNGEF